MKIIGAVTEFNPFHAGHTYFLQQIKAQCSPDAVVCVMSASFVQRGEPACYDKFSRTRAALAGGADMVLELPAPVSLQSAQYFALGAVRLLESCGMVSGLAFGCEESVALTDIDGAAFRAAMDQGASYASALGVEAKPNSLLGLEYLRALQTLGSDMQVTQIKRAAQYKSAHALRTELAGSGDKNFLCREQMLVPLLVCLRSMEQAQLASISQVGEGIEYRILKQARTAKGLEQLVNAVKSKRYTYSRISRIMCCALLGITADITDAVNNGLPYIRVLGVRKDKQQLLPLLCGSARLPVVTNVADYMRASSGFGDKLMRLECRATDIRAALAGQDGGADYTNGLIVL